MKKLKLKKEVIVTLKTNRVQQRIGGNRWDTFGCLITDGVPCEELTDHGCVPKLTDMCDLSEDYCASLDVCSIDNVCSIGLCSEGCKVPTNPCDTIAPIG